MAEVNGVIKNLPLTEPKALHIIPIPAGIKATEEIFLPGETTIDAGYELNAQSASIELRAGVRSTDLIFAVVS